MATSRAFSPASDGSPSPVRLSPRSRLQAMLAASKDESDDEDTSPSREPNVLSRVSSTDSPTRQTTKISAPSDDDEEEVVFKPRGRLAARMLAVRSDNEGDGDDEAQTARDRVRKLLTAKTSRSPKADAETDDGNKLESARDRVRRLLVANKDSSSKVENEAKSGNSTGNEDEDAVVAPRKRKLGLTREITPVPIPTNAEQDSPGGMFISPASDKAQSPTPVAPESDEDLPPNPGANARFLALVQKKRQERLAKEAENERLKAEKAAERKRLSQNHSDMLEEDAIEYSDDDGSRRLTQQARPTRKASKKALEEMHRETQRLSRNMQLAHEARTKKKITKSSLFAKFNYKPAGFVDSDPVEQPRPTSSSSAPHTDVEMRDTPPTSPVSHAGDITKAPVPAVGGVEVENEHLDFAGNEEDDIPTLEEALSQHVASSPPRIATRSDKGKGKAVEEPESIPLKESVTAKKAGVISLPPLRIRPAKIAAESKIPDDDSDSDLEILPVQAPAPETKESIFDRVPAKQAQESHSLVALRMLAHLTSPGKQPRGRNVKPSMTAVELQMNLQQRARQQARREREERLKALRASGVIVQTAEERVKEMAEMEDLMAKARREGEEISKREKAAAKKERKANGETGALDDSDDDEDWEEEKEKFAEQMSGSGSESDGDDEGEASGEEDLDEEDEEEAMSGIEEEGTAEPIAMNSLIDHEASETESEHEDAEMSDGEAVDPFIDDGNLNLKNPHDDEEEELTHAPVRRRTKHLVVSDDEDEQDMVMQSPILQRTESIRTSNIDSPMAPPSVLRSATKTFIPGLTVAGPAGLGLTQIFAGTMDESQTQAFDASQDMQSPSVRQFDTAQDSLAFLRNLPPPDLPAFEPTIDDTSQDMVRDSQTQIAHFPESPLAEAVSQNMNLHFSQSQIHGFDSMLQGPWATQLSEFPEPTQDAGFQTLSPIKGRFVEPPPSTVETVLLQQTPVPEQIHDTPIAKKKGKLRRRAELLDLSDDEMLEPEKEAEPAEEDEFEISENVFDVMRKASKRKEVVEDDFDKKKSAAKEMVQEQAEESEDEYAGLGGASDDESGGDEDAFVKEMIDDEGGKDVDESKLAAFYADKERASDEKQVEKLFKDITNGMLRRKRGADYDLSDSDDGGEARRRMKRKEFAKMRKALLEDERIGKIAENPKKMAFLRAIEDRGSDDEMDFLDDFAEPGEPGTDSQSQSQGEDSQKVVQLSNSQPDTIMGPPKRKFPHDTEPEARLPPHLRRTQPAKRPTNLSEIRQSLSSLIEEPNAILASHSGSDSDSEDDHENGDGRGSGDKHKGKENHDPFASRRTASIAVVDRISLKRAASNATSTTTRLAFAAPSATADGFKIPSLLRRSTTNTSLLSTSNSSSSLSGMSGTERTAGGLSNEGTVAKKAGKNSGVNYFARENERKAKVVAGEKKREERRFKGAEGRRRVVGGLFGSGKFE